MISVVKNQADVTRLMIVGESAKNRTNALMALGMKNTNDSRAHLSITDSKTSKISSNMNNNSVQLSLNIFGIGLEEREIFRHVVQIKLVDHKNKKDFILTTMSSRGRGNRASKQRDNFILTNRVLDHFIAENKKIKPDRDTKLPVAYDGAQTLFALEPIAAAIEISNEDALQIPGISNFLVDSLKFLNGVIEVTCDPDLDKPSFNQIDFKEWEDPRFYGYLDIVTSQGAIKSGKYLSQSKGLYVNTQYMMNLKNGWAVGAKGVHKGCRIVGQAGSPLPILELDPQSTQYYAPITLAELLLKAFPRDFSEDPRRGPTNPNSKIIRAAKTLFRDLKCNPFYSDLNDWATNTIIVSDLDYAAPTNAEYAEKHEKLKYPHFPAALCGIGPNKRRYPLEKLRILPYQSIDRRVLEEFDLTPRANAPNERWADLQNHFVEFQFNDEIMDTFGVRLCNDPFENISEIAGDRVDKPAISYANPVHVDDAKRDWRARDDPFSTPSNIDYLVVVLIVGYTRNFQMDCDATKFFANEFVKRCKEKGMKIARSEFQSLNSDQKAESFLTYVFSEMVNNPQYSKSSFKPFVLLISDDVPNIHECLKFEERMSDVPTQHVLLKNIRKISSTLDTQIKQRRKPFDLTLDNIVMKANIKSGGLNYKADIPRDLACWDEVPTFVIGLDVAHPDKMSVRDGNPSTVGLSCNSAESPYTFIGDFAYTTARKEAIDDEILRSFTARNVKQFAEARGFPKKIIIFRDGVSFGEEIEAEREAEIIQQTIISMAHEAGVRNYKPSVLAVVVKKRHHTRFYGRGGNGGNQPTNPLPDTAVCGDIAEYGKRQIFIQAFRPVQGTAKVPSFLVIRDDEEVTDEHISKLVCAVCSLHQYVNSPTSIPTPVFVAHELAKRGTGLFKAYKFKNGEIEQDWPMLTRVLSYSTQERLSKIRVA
ncbi:unnamed protein product [Caenorhabditis angaria]|uniref:Piwi domain-containing protein n=1 Tax=Caenorhabditis angaria TaxID=860376 RepID=A0A9P1N4Z6_9PELO|nr:unnamed protein product [Caenorhabditis angaria]